MSFVTAAVEVGAGGLADPFGGLLAMLEALRLLIESLRLGMGERLMSVAAALLAAEVDEVVDGAEMVAVKLSFESEVVDSVRLA